MELPDLSLLFSSLIIGTVGLGMFLYGKRKPEPKCLGIGAVMCVYPYFVHSLLVMWLIAGACAVAAYFLPSFE